MIEIWRAPYQLDEWAVVYPGRRFFTVAGAGVGEEHGLYNFGAGLIERRWVTIGTAPIAGALEVLQGYPNLSDDAYAAPVIAAVRRGDYSWLEPRRTEFSVLVFVPPPVDRQMLVRTIGAIPSTAPPDASILRETDGWAVVRPLGADLAPSPGSEAAERLEVLSRRWGGHGSWELVARWPESLGDAIEKIAAVHDLAIFTVEENFRDRENILKLAELAGGYWTVDWYGSDDVLFEDDDDHEPLPPVELKPGWQLAGPVSEWAVVYEDGCVFTCHGHRVSEVDGRYLFLADTTDGEVVQIGSATIEANSTIQPR